MKRINKIIITFSALLLNMFCNNINAQVVQPWETLGNININATTDFLGTINREPVRIKAYNHQCMLISQWTGYIGMGINNPSNKLHIHSTDRKNYNEYYSYPDPSLTEYPSWNYFGGGYANGTPFAALQITNNDNRVSPGDGLQLYLYGEKGFLRQLAEDNLCLAAGDIDAIDITHEGYVGIGTNNPLQKLHIVDGNILISKGINGAPDSENGSILFGPEASSSCKGVWGIEYLDNQQFVNTPGLNFWKIYSCGLNGFNFGLFLSNNGNVGIGVGDPQEKLVVDGTICAKEVLVSLSGSPCWPDYVFDKDYKLMSLKELESFIKTNKHLPNVPSSKDVIDNGIQLGEMNAILLEKIEELTLHIITLEKRISEMENKRDKSK